MELVIWMCVALREYWRWMHPKTYLFPGTKDGWRADKPITPKAALPESCSDFWQADGIGSTETSIILTR